MSLHGNSVGAEAQTMSKNNDKHSYSSSVTLSIDPIRRLARNSVPAPIYAAAADCTNTFWGTLRLGWSTYRSLRRLCPDKATSSLDLVQLELPVLRHPIHIRPGTTDARETIHSVVRRVYGALLPAEPVRLIVDAGANIGDTTAWYLSSFPHATVVALEPDPGNFAVLEKNCKPYGPRAVLLNAALWPTAGRLYLRKSGLECDEYQVTSDATSADESEGPCQGLSVWDLFHCANAETIDVLKLDIEGAELQLFGPSSDAWLPKVRSIVVEVHSPEAHQAVLSQTRRHGFHHRIYRDTDIFWR